MSTLEEALKIAKAQAILALFATVPGYWFIVALIDRLGRFKIQLMGFFMMTVFMFALGIPYYHWRGEHKDLATGKYQGGHPTELFPARLRSTCHGISAAAGKAGAIIGAFGFAYASQSRSAERCWL